MQIKKINKRDDCLIKVHFLVAAGSYTRACKSGVVSVAGCHFMYMTRMLSEVDASSTSWEMGEKLK